VAASDAEFTKLRLLNFTRGIIGVIVKFLRLGEFPIHIINKDSKKRPLNDIDPTPVVTAEGPIKFPDTHQPTKG